ncbi:hypothetical protein CCAX7_60180 [Capsulimonas corticalis]|uniref:Uncharacterized protein n=1 Tax=Capsulimonas corticalis TaxID=2219043 RepID=A0A402CVW9_9BACT|nr:DUF1622 domain-containing protein [Capsulimonas corticalis]BDI33967.1 hypothetical protein CCAX7_60180 [Capsulimonas corticalis]
MEIMHLNAEGGVRLLVQWLRLGVETLGALIVGMGVLLAAILFLKALLARETANFNAIRLLLARYLALALEFQLGADILSTAVAPSWTEIGKLGAIAVIRTTLNYFLSKEMKEERGGDMTGAEIEVEAKAVGK